jgi:hypothetical protein
MLKKNSEPTTKRNETLPDQIQALVKRVKRNATGVVIAGAMVILSRRPPGFGGYAVLEENHQGGTRKGPRDSSRKGLFDEKTGNNLHSLNIRTEQQSNFIEIGKTPVSASIERLKTSDVMHVKFEDGSSLQVKLRKDSIKRIYVRRVFDDGYIYRPISVDDFAKVMGECNIAGVSYPSGNGYSGGFSPMGSNDELAFRRSDGTELVVELNPGAIINVTFDKK